VFAGKHFASAAKAGGDFVENKKDIIAPANFAERFHITHRL
jgi:hypothetical protein